MDLAFPPIEELNRRRFEKTMQREAPRKLYVIYFTPRSGSTWLTDLCTQTGHLGTPGEHFNVKTINNTSRIRNVVNLDEYVGIVLRQKSIDGIFGFEITVPHMIRSFGSAERFEGFFGKPAAFFLTRRDLVRQALSIIKFKQTSVSHYRGTSEEERADAETKFTYSAEAIRRASTNVVSMEKRSERYFRRHGIEPIRLEYETLIATPPIDVANQMLRGIGEPEIETFDFAPALQRTGSAKNDAFAEEFRATNGDYLAELDARRRAPLRGVD